MTSTSTDTSRTAESAEPVRSSTVDEPVALVIMGASGDLTSRLLLPGLASLIAARGPAPITLIGAARSDEWDTERWQSLVRDTFTEAGVEDEQTNELVDKARWMRVDATSTDDLTAMLETAAEGTEAQVVYFALPPAITEKSCEVIAQIEDRPAGLRLALEKPFGDDLESAERLNTLLTTIVPENRIFRVDHFLGESMVLTMLTLRTANRVLERSWNAEDIEKVEVVWDEEIALEGRAGYYDSAGALIDMLQSHLLQVLAYVAMETPASLEHEDVHAAIAAVLRATRVAGDDPAASSRRARYLAGTSLGRDVPDYASEDGVDPDRDTETLAEVTLDVNTRRWHGVPFILRSGKALAPARKQVVLTFRPPRFTPDGLSLTEGRDRLVITLDPEELHLDLSVDGADTPFFATRAELGAALGESDIEPYGDVLQGILTGDPLLSVRGDVAEQSWRIMEPVLTAWAEGEVPLEEYPAGSTGPEGWDTNAE